MVKESFFIHRRATELKPCGCGSNRMETTDTEEHFFFCYYIPSFSFFAISALYSVFLPRFCTLECTGPIKKLKGGNEGEKPITIFRYS